MAKRAMLNGALLEVCSAADFQAGKWETERRPCIVRGADIGQCCRLWSDSNYLRQQVGPKSAVVHVCASKQLDFLSKNFKYVTVPFDELLSRCQPCGDESLDAIIEEGESYYFRALATGDAKGTAARLGADFPQLAADVRAPSFVPEERLFSSVLRLSSAGVQLWTHYDVMDNALVQVVGRKRVVLFSPLDVPYLYLSGDKSKVLDVDAVDTQRFPLFQQASPLVGTLLPGDCLLIPSLWFHNITALDYSVAVNFFWRHLDDTLYDGKDVYGNRDPQPAQRARQGLDKALINLSQLPRDHRQFYALQMIDRLRKYVAEQ